MDIEELYQQKLQAMAKTIEQESSARQWQNISVKHFVENLAPYRGEKTSKLCGSHIKVGFSLMSQPHSSAEISTHLAIDQIAYVVESCLLGKTATAITQQLLPKLELAHVKLIRHLLSDMLQDKRAEMPKPYESYNLLQPAKVLTSRHSAILLPLDVVIENWRL